MKQKSMFFWNSLAFSMVQQMLAIWSLVPLPFLNPACTFESSWFTKFRSLYLLWLMIYSEKAMAPHSSILTWKIPWPEEPGGLQSIGSLGVGHDWATSLSRIGEGNGNPLQCSCLENPRDGGAWWAAVSGVAQSRTRLKRQQQQHCYCYLDLCQGAHCFAHLLSCMLGVKSSPVKKTTSWYYYEYGFNFMRPVGDLTSRVQWTTLWDPLAKITTLLGKGNCL